jgi:hypothetical protein
VWALGRLGDNFKRRYLGQNVRPEDKLLTDEQKAKVVADLQAEAGGESKRAEWARLALHYIEGKGRLAEAHAAQGVDVALEQVSRADNPFLRELVAHALNFWDGPRVEPTLQRLARDDGHGTRVEVTEAD